MVGKATLNSSRSHPLHGLLGKHSPFRGHKTTPSDPGRMQCLGCHRNRQFLDVLARKIAYWVPATDPIQWLLDSLPTSVLRCGMFPAAFSVPADIAMAIVLYLCDCNHDANLALVARRSGRPWIPTVPGVFNESAAAALNGRAMAPCKKVKTAANVSDHSSIAAKADDHVDHLTIAVDGSYKSCRQGQSAGWGFCVARPGTLERLHSFAPLTLDPSVSHFVGAIKLSNNAAELGGIAALASWLLLRPPSDEPTTVQILFDSYWASLVSRRIWRPASNVPAVVHTLRLLEQLHDRKFQLLWHHTKSHIGHHLNEHADVNADHGRLGGISLLTRDSFERPPGRT